MNLSYWCILIAGILPVVTVAVAKWGRRDFDNAEPRQWMEKLQGLRRRADNAHRNHFEAFPFFAAGVLVAQQLNADQDSINMLAVTFIAARIVYTLLYLANRPTMRSITWVIGYIAVIGLFLLPAFDGI
jgi:uncharacterized MAPEG superfamily protein